MLNTSQGKFLQSIDSLCSIGLTYFTAYKRVLNRSGSERVVLTPQSARSQARSCFTAHLHTSQKAIAKTIEESIAMNATNGIISQPSPYSVTETIDRLSAVLEAKDITIFARIDQQAEAEKVGLKLSPTQLLLFGSPKAGTPLMVAEPTIALDLPLKVVAWAAADGKVWLSYNDPNYLQQRFSLSDELVKNIAVIAPLIDYLR
jgi:uncharacterized protein (DUF302 family)